MDTLDYFLNKYKAQFVKGTKQPIEIAGMLRTDLAQDFAELDFKRGVEIGVERGQFSRYLCKTNKQLQLYSIDPYQAYTGYRDYLAQELLDRFYQEAQDRLKNYPNCHLVRKFSMDVLADFEDNSLDFCFIDGNHEIPWVMDDICWWASKVRIGGVVAGHDYFISKRSTRTQIHVKYAVDCAAQSLYVDPYFMIGSFSEWDRLTALRERPSWFWVKDAKQWTFWGTS